MKTKFINWLNLNWLSLLQNIFFLLFIIFFFIIMIKGVNKVQKINFYKERAEYWREAYERCHSETLYHDKIDK